MARSKSRAPVAALSVGASSGRYAAPHVPDYVICELKYDSQVTMPRGAESFHAPEPAAPTRDALNRVLEHFSVKRVAPHFGHVLKKKDIARRALESVAVPGASAPDAEFALAGFIEIVPE